MERRTRLLDHALSILASRVDDVLALIDATGKLRLRLDRYDWFTASWFTKRTGRPDASALKFELILEFEAVSSSARKVGGRTVLQAATSLDALRGPVLGVVDPPDNNGVSDEEAHLLMGALDDVRNAATAALARKRWLLVSALAIFLLGAAAGYVLALVLR